MYFEDNKLVFSSSDLVLYFRSPFASAMEHAILINPELKSQKDIHY